MITLILHLFGLAWVLGHGGYWLIAMACSVGAVYLLYTKGYLVGVRGAVLALACFADWGTGILVAALLRTYPTAAKPTVSDLYGGW